MCMFMVVFCLQMYIREEIKSFLRGKNFLPVAVNVNLVECLLTHSFICPFLQENAQLYIGIINIKLEIPI